MISFQNDYSEGCYPEILQRLTDTNLEQTCGYGLDDHCNSAREKLKGLCHAPDADVHFLTGGTQTNLTVISAVLRPWQGVLSPDSGHIATHETGAIEATGHKVITIPSADGTLNPQDVEDFCAQYWASDIPEHMVEPGMVYVSHPTENGTLYSLSQLEALRQVCDRHGMVLFLDGARLGYGLACPDNDVTLPDLARLCDVFYVGGTKCGALFGEAVVVTNPALKLGFRNMIKQRGGMLAKGRLLGVQFDTLFTDDLYVRGCRQAVEQGRAISAAFQAKGISMFIQSPTNQQFPVLSEAQIATLSQRYLFQTWGPVPGGVAVRFCTSWATRPEDVAALIGDIRWLDAGLCPDPPAF